MQKILLSAFLVLQTICYSQAPVIEWQKNFGGSGNETINVLKQDADGGYVVIGSTNSTDGDIIGNHGNYDYWVVKLNSNGNINWQKTYGGTNDEMAYGADLTSDGGYIICGSSNSTDGDVTGNHGSGDIWIIKINATGNLEWQKSLGGTGTESARSIRATNDGGYIISGSSTSRNGDATFNFGSFDYWIIKLDNIGTIVWQKSFGGLHGDTGWDIQQTLDNGYIISGYTSSIDGMITENHGAMDAWVIKLNAAGTLQWQKTYGGMDFDFGFNIREALDGGYIFVGRSDNTAGADIDSWIVKIDNIGNVLWEKKYRGSGMETFYDIKPTIDNGYIIAGYSSSNDNDFSGNHGDVDYCVFKIDSMGNKLWQKSLGGSGYDAAGNILQSSDGGYIVSGIVNSADGDLNANHGLADSWVVKLAPETLQAKTFNLPDMIVYPNPVNSYINIQLQEGIEVDKITILDITGKVIMKDKSKRQINTQNLPSGSYILQAFSGTKKYESKFIKQ